MIPFLLAIAGGYLIGQSRQDEKFSNGGDLYALPQHLVDEIQESVKMGYDTIKEGLISPKTKGIVLVNKDYEVRGKYPLGMKPYIQKLVDGFKKLGNGGGVDDDDIFSKRIESEGSKKEEEKENIKSIILKNKTRKSSKSGKGSGKGGAKDDLTDEELIRKALDRNNFNFTITGSKYEYESEAQTIVDGIEVVFKYFGGVDEGAYDIGGSEYYSIEKTYIDSVEYKGDLKFLNESQKETLKQIYFVLSEMPDDYID